MDSEEILQNPFQDVKPQIKSFASSEAGKIRHLPGTISENNKLWVDPEVAQGYNDPQAGPNAGVQKGNEAGGNAEICVNREGSPSGGRFPVAAAGPKARGVRGERFFDRCSRAAWPSVKGALRWLP